MSYQILMPTVRSASFHIISSVLKCISEYFSSGGFICDICDLPEVFGPEVHFGRFHFGRFRVAIFFFYRHFGSQMNDNCRINYPHQRQLLDLFFFYTLPSYKTFGILIFSFDNHCMSCCNNAHRQFPSIRSGCDQGFGLMVFNLIVMDPQKSQMKSRSLYVLYCMFFFLLFSILCQKCNQLFFLSAYFTLKKHYN